MMKIALSIKPYMKKVYIALMLLVCVAGMPVQAHAGFFSNLVTKVIGSNAQADAIDTGNVNTNNSQTMSLLEPATNPGMGDEVVATKTEPVSIIDPSASALTPITSPLGQGADIEQYQKG